MRVNAPNGTRAAVGAGCGVGLSGSVATRQPDLDEAPTWMTVRAVRACAGVLRDALFDVPGMHVLGVPVTAPGWC
jgi:hypothetical protein